MRWVHWTVPRVIRSWSGLLSPTVRTTCTLHMIHLNRGWLRERDQFWVEILSTIWIAQAEEELQCSETVRRCNSLSNHVFDKMCTVCNIQHVKHDPGWHKFFASFLWGDSFPRDLKRWISHLCMKGPMKPLPKQIISQRSSSVGFKSHLWNFGPSENTWSFETWMK